MGCMQSRVKPDQWVNQTESKKSKLNVLQMPITPHVSDRFNDSTTSLAVMHSTSVTMMERLSVTPVIWSKSEDSAQHSEFFTTTSRHNISTTPTSIDSKEMGISRTNVPRSFDMTSNISDIPEVSSMSISSSELNPQPSICSFIISPSSDLNHRTFRQDAINRFLFSRPKRPVNYPVTTHDNKWNKSNESYSVRDDIISSVSVHSGELTPNRTKIISTKFIQSTISNVQRKKTADQATGESNGSLLDHILSASKDMKVKKSHLVTPPRSTSVRLSNPK